MSAAFDVSSTGPSLALRRQVLIFLAFAFAYFLSALLRAVTATLAPVFSAQLGLAAADLGLLAGAYFLGFACTQLPLGSALDRAGPKRVILGLLVLATIGCAAFAAARDLTELVASRMLIGIGVSACLMAPLTCFRRRFSPAAQLRANSWMLMTGSLGMVASTAPLQALLPYMEWRGVFWLVGALLALSIVGIMVFVPADEPTSVLARPGSDASIATIVRHPLFRRLVPIAFFSYGGLLAVQALWAGPWLTAVSGWSADAAAQGLLLVNLCMLATFFVWGVVMPRLARSVEQVLRVMTVVLPVSLVVLAWILVLGARSGAVHWAIWCMASSAVALSQSALAQAFPVNLAGRALSTYNLVMFVGVFVLQWTMGIAIDAAGHLFGVDTVTAYRGTFAIYLALSTASYLWFVLAPRLAHNPSPQREP